MRTTQRDVKFDEGVASYRGGEHTDALTWLAGWLPSLPGPAHTDPRDPGWTLGSGLAQAQDLEKAAGSLLAGYVAEARRRGITWQQIADGLGVSRQAAQQRFSGD